MASEEVLPSRYQPTRYTLLQKQVWAIVTRQADGSWRIVNCLDKDAPCFNLECAFTTDGGHWPFEDVLPGQRLAAPR